MGLLPMNMAFTISTPRLEWQQALYSRPWIGLLLLSLAHIASRVLISSGMKWDEAEQILWAQNLSLGYGPQPPLYSWIQWAVCQLLGPSVLALAVLKHALIALTYCCAWLAGRQLFNEKGAWWVAASLLLMPPFGWDSLRDQTHTVMVTAMTMGLWWAVLRQVQRPQAVNFVLIGIFCSLGMLSKYSYAMLLAALFVAAMSVPHVRSALFSQGWWLAPLTGLLLLAPHAYWLASHWGMATTETVQKMSISSEVSHLKGLGNLSKALLSTLGLWLLSVALSYRSLLWRSSPESPASVPSRTWALPLFQRYLLIIILSLLGMVLAADVTDFKQRWILPLTACLPLALYVWRPALLAHDTGKTFTAIALAFALIFLTMATLRPWHAGWKNAPDELNHPIKELARQLSASGYNGQGVVVGSDHMLAAMLHSRFPDTYAMGCQDSKQLQQCLVQAKAHQAHPENGLLLITRLDKPVPGWWSGVFSLLPATPIQALSLPFEKMPAPGEAAQYQYVWIASKAQP